MLRISFLTAVSRTGFEVSMTLSTVVGAWPRFSTLKYGCEKDWQCCADEDGVVGEGRKKV
jgi:hypothetical protein